MIRKLNVSIFKKVREFLEPSSIGGSGLSISRSSSRQRSGLVTPDSELADEEVDRLGQHQSDEVLGDGERALVHAMCNVMTQFIYLFD